MLGGLKDPKALTPFDVQHFQPFDPVHKRTEATVRAADGSVFKVSKGAPQVILDLVGAAPDVKAAATKAVDDFAGRGFRALGVARQDGSDGWKLVGVLPLFDPPREDAAATVATAGKMGVAIKMVTGDALAIARETAKTLGMGADILDGASLGDSKHEETAATGASIEQADGFAQVFPEHKFHIVDVLQKRGHIVGMTGDGVNDAPALKKADCGIAVSGATDAARAAASIVLMTPGLSVIIEAIKESRKIFQRMNSYAIYRIAETLRVLLFMTLAILVFNFYPLTAVMIVMLALLNDGAILSIAYDNVRYRDEPEAWNMRVVLGVATVLGLVGSDRGVRIVLPRRPSVPSGPSASADDDVPAAVGGGASDHFPDADPRPILVDPPRLDPAGRRDRHAGHRHAGGGLRRLGGAAARLAAGRAGLGLRPDLVPGHRPDQAAGLQGPRHGPGRPGRENRIAAAHARRPADCRGRESRRMMDQAWSWVAGQTLLLAGDIGATTTPIARAKPRQTAVPATSE